MAMTGARTEGLSRPLGLGGTGPSRAAGHGDEGSDWQGLGLELGAEAEAECQSPAQAGHAKGLEGPGLRGARRLRRSGCH
eukprot:1650368-Rhodomonas_salina.1